MTEPEALAVADRPDWWMGADAPDRMRTLGEAIAAAIAGTAKDKNLFRPGGYGTRSVWRADEEIDALHRLLQASAR